jgi:hypothetical protein
MDPVDLTKRLALIRYLYRMAERQSEMPLPTGAIAVLYLHDCWEWFLITAGEYCGIDSGRWTLLEHFDQLAATTRLTSRTTLVKVLSARKELKHRLTLPAPSSILELRYGTKIFLTENSVNLFNVDFDSVSLKDVIQDNIVKEHINNAMNAKEHSDYVTTMQQIRIAYDRLTNLFRLNLRPGWPHACGVDSLELFYFDRLIPTYDIQGFAAFGEGCDFCLEFILDATIKLEQQMSSARVKRMDMLLSHFNDLMKRK